MTDLGLIPVWLFIIAMASVMQVLVLITVVVVVRGSTRRMTDALNVIERAQIGPLVAHVHDALNDMRDVAARAKAADEDVRLVVARTSDRARRAAWAVRTRLWPMIRLTRGVLAAVGTLTESRRLRRSHQPARFEGEL